MSHSDSAVSWRHLVAGITRCMHLGLTQTIQTLGAPAGRWATMGGNQ